MKLDEVTDEIVAAIRLLSRHRQGAILIWNPAITIAGPCIGSPGVPLDALVSRQLLITIFAPESTLRAGLAIISGNRIERAAVPLRWTDVVERAVELAVGVALRVDEDTGKIQIVDRMAHLEVVGAASLAGALREHARQLRRR